MVNIMIEKMYKKFEQAILFYCLLIYMGIFSVVFNEELRTFEWATILWLVQFFGLGSLLFFYGKKKGWKWPQR